ncbi:CDP-alcohol phosphatidyltransferase-domain-containing protein [Lyophyllum atratum]|nr:CDP-alcohol phosphatidyltransferase-domain-containing protein [Lyophyllum atratum]
MLKSTTSRFSIPSQLCRAQRHRASRFLPICRRELLRQPCRWSPASFFAREFSVQRHLCYPQTPDEPTGKPAMRENIYTLPNALTVSRIIACPILGWSILQGDFHLATGLLVYAGLTDLADGYLARRFKMQTVLGTILDPAADKTLMTTLTVTLAMKGLLPLPVAVIILGRDVLLSLSAFYIRYTSLPEPKTFSRYWDFSLPSAEIRPTAISKINTALQLALMGTTTISPLLPFELGSSLTVFQWVVATTTVWSGLSYIFTKDAVRLVSQRHQQKPPSI